jgi:hypothetical protein
MRSAAAAEHFNSRLHSWLRFVPAVLAVAFRVRLVDTCLAPVHPSGQFLVAVMPTCWRADIPYGRRLQAELGMGIDRPGMSVGISKQEQQDPQALSDVTDEK